MIDLHLHTTASDGTASPAQTVQTARELGLTAIAVTDHDTVSGVGEALAHGAALGVEVVPGVEVSSDYRDNNIHVLGYFIDPASPALRAVADWVRVERAERNEKVVTMLAADGFAISMEELEAAYPGALLGRPHIAEFLMRRGYVESVTDGFDRYLEVGRKYYLPTRRIPLSRAVTAIRDAGGLASLAHPLQYRYPLPEVEELIDRAVHLGVDAMECYYSGYMPEETRWLLTQAERRGLGVSGGSDWHGTRKPYITMGRGTGELCISETILEKLKERHRSA